MSETVTSVRDLAQDDVRVSRLIGDGSVFLHVGEVLVWVRLPEEDAERRKERAAALRKLSRLAAEGADEAEPEGESAWGVVA